MNYKMTLLGAAAALPLGLVGPAQAQDWYGQVFGGITFPESATFSGTIGGGPQSVFTDLDEGYNLGFSVGGYLPALGNGAVRLRGELELSYNDNDVTGTNFSGNGPAPEINTSGDITSTNLFANVLADFQTGSAFTPYIGAELGVSFVDQGFVYGPGVTISGSDEVFAGQLIAGGSYALNDNTALFADARFIRAFDVSGTRTSPGGHRAGSG